LTHVTDAPAALSDLRLIIFDCDGVLIDSEMLSCDALIVSLAAHGVTIDRDFVFRECIGHSLPAVIEKLSGLNGRHVPACFEADYRSTLLQSFDRDLRPVAGIEAILANLALPYCVATSSNEERAQRSLAAAGLANLGAPVFTAAMVKHGKPAPDLFLHAARSMGVAPHECLVIEDSMPGIRAARAAGMAVWRFTGGSHFKAGFGEGDPCFADITFADWNEFTPLLQRSLSPAGDAL